MVPLAPLQSACSLRPRARAPRVDPFPPRGRRHLNLFLPLRRAARGAVLKHVGAVISAGALVVCGLNFARTPSVPAGRASSTILVLLITGLSRRFGTFE